MKGDESVRAFKDCNPFAVAIYILAVAGVTMFSTDPICNMISLFGGAILYSTYHGRNAAKMHGFALLVVFASVVINTLVSHNGKTVLFVLNDNPITLEAMLFGLSSGLMIAAVMYWFGCFSFIMTSDKLLYIFGALSPRLALVFSMTLRYIPLFKSQLQRVVNTQKALGLYSDDNIIDKARFGIRVFSVMVTWSLENGIITADSMTARGYGTHKRTHFSVFKFTLQDAFMLTVSILLLLLSAFGINHAGFEFYPEISLSISSYITVLGYISYGILCILPSIINLKEALRWKYLSSKI